MVIRDFRKASLKSLSVLIAALAVPFPGPTVRAEELDKSKVYESANDPLAITIEEMRTWSRDFEMLFRVNADPVLRAIVCRVPFTNWSLDALAMGTDIPKDRFFDSMRLLDEMGLVTHSERNGITIIRPASEFARVKMRKFAREWCTSDDTCGVKK